MSFEIRIGLYSRLIAENQDLHAANAKLQFELGALQQYQTDASRKIAELNAENAKLRQRCGELERDAARYRWLKDSNQGRALVIAYTDYLWDEAIDARIAGK